MKISPAIISLLAYIQEQSHEHPLHHHGDYKELSEDDKEILRNMARVMRERRANKKD